MADTQPLAPTDAEIVALACATRTAEGGANGYILPISFARAVLAKWGAQPVPASAAEFALRALVAAGHVTQERVDQALALPCAPVRGGEPVGYTHASWITAANRGGGGHFAGRKMPGFDVPIYTAPQPVAREPLTEQQLVDIFRSIDSEDKGRWAVVVSFARAIERAHGITGGQHVGRVD